MQQVLCLLRVYNMFQNFVRVTSSNMTYVYVSLVSAFSPKTYIYFEEIATPYLQHTVTLQPSCAAPQWSYSEEKQVFTEWGYSSDAFPKALPILSMTIVDQDTVLYDISDFVERIRVTHSNRNTFPSVAHILGAWSLSSGIVLNTTKSYFAKMITISAETVTVPITSHEYFTVANELPPTDTVD